LAEIQNPNQQGGSGFDARSILAFSVVFLLIFLGLQFFKQKKAADTPAPAQQKASAPATPSPSQQAPAAATETNASAVPDANAVQAAAESQTVVENELYRITFSNRGGDVTSWVLKKYKDDDGKPLDLVNHLAAAKYGLPLSLNAYDEGLRTRLNQALYVPSTTGTVNAPGSVSFEYSAGGLHVKKTFTFDSTYVIHAEISATNQGAPLTTQLLWPSGFGDQTSLPQYAASFLDTAKNGDVDQTAPKKVSGGATLSGPFQWAGVSDLYFAAIFLPDQSDNVSLLTLHNTIDLPRNPKHPDPKEIDHPSVLGAGIGDSASGTYSARLFAGPKSLDVLNSVPTHGAPSLEKVVSFGWWGWIAKPMFLVLRFFYEHTIHNWGWAILLLTLILNVAMMPTRVQMMKSSLKMQRIQPQMDVIKAKYAKYKATDPRRQEMNKEMFDLQKREGVNMFGGCLPMLLQYPLLFGFYRMLMYAIELRQAHWLWLPDLSAPDPTRILPIFVILSMFLTQFFTPSPGMDRSQQRMMAFMMPAVFGFMMWNIGSGVALYWACSNLLGVAQQLVMNRTSMGREMRAIAMKRAAKKTGKVVNARR
jgi:YidC/Oxa1 family membrane protein insertase